MKEACLVLHPLPIPPFGNNNSTCDIYEPLPIINPLTDTRKVLRPIRVLRSRYVSPGGNVRDHPPGFQHHVCRCVAVSANAARTSCVYAYIGYTYTIILILLIINICIWYVRYTPVILLHNIPYTVYCIPRTVYRIPYTAFCISCTVYGIPYTVYNIPHRSVCTYAHTHVHPHSHYYADKYAYTCVDTYYIHTACICAPACGERGGSLGPEQTTHKPCHAMPCRDQTAQTTH